MRIPPPPLRPTPTSRPKQPKTTAPRKQHHVVGRVGPGLVRRGAGGGGDVEEALRELADERAGREEISDTSPEDSGLDGEAEREVGTLDLEGMCAQAKRIRGNNPAQTLDYVLIPALPATHVQEDFPPSSAEDATPPPHASGSPSSAAQEDEDGWEMIGEDGEDLLQPVENEGEAKTRRKEYAEVARRG